jgi:phosphopentomutase/2,3-bisphosphoglycerate-independent phosphoglycerate mutase family metalloenzyme
MFPLISLMAALAIPAPTTNVILITLDGVRWQEIFNGTDPVLDDQHLSARELLPNFYDLFVDKGVVIGQKSRMIASGPNHISLPGYLEITRGHPSTDCQRNDCIPKIDQSVFFMFDRPAIFSSWEVIEKTVPPYYSVVVDTGRAHRSLAWERTGFPDFFGSPTPFTWLPDYRPDFFTDLVAEAYIEVMHPDFAWLAMGDCDEWGHANNYRRYRIALQEADDYVGRLIRTLDATDYGRNTVFIITADHGRAINFRDHGSDQASERVWMLIRGKGIPFKGSIKLPTTVRLSNILPTIEDIEGLPDKGSLLPMIRSAQ